MTTADDVRRVALALPRAYEQMTRGRWKLKVRQIVFCAFSRDETVMGLASPRPSATADRVRPGDVLPPAHRPLLHPHLHFDDGRTSVRGRVDLLRHLRDSPTPKPPTSVEIRDGQVYRWVR